jgi:hypothetical protein
MEKYRSYEETINSTTEIIKNFDYKKLMEMTKEELKENLDQLSSLEREKFIMALLSLILESEPGSGLKNWAKNTLAFLSGNFTPSKQGEDEHGQAINLKDHYPIIINNRTVRLSVFADQRGGNHLSALRNLHGAEKDYEETYNLSGKSHNFSIYNNLSETNLASLINLNGAILKVNMPTGEEKNLLYLSDRIISKEIRGQKIGKQLLELADQIAKDNNCQLIFGVLVPEDTNDQKAMAGLKKTHQEFGYEIIEKNKLNIAVKHLTNF